MLLADPILPQMRLKQTAPWLYVWRLWSISNRLLKWARAIKVRSMKGSHYCCKRLEKISDSKLCMYLLPREQFRNLEVAAPSFGLTRQSYAKFSVSCFWPQLGCIKKYVTLGWKLRTYLALVGEKKVCEMNMDDLHSQCNYIEIKVFVAHVVL